MMALRQTDLPEPVEPATIRWGISARLLKIMLPPMSLPRAKINLWPPALNSSVSTSSRMVTGTLLALGISMPRVPLPGDGPFDAHGAGLGAQGDVVGQGHHAAHLHARGQGDLVAGDGGPGQTSTTLAATPKLVSTRSRLALTSS